MASRTDLNGFLRTEEDNIQQALSEWAPSITTERIRVRARWRGQGSSSEEAVAELTVVRPKPSAVAGIVDDLERQITKTLGGNPDGTLRVLAYEEGSSGKPAVNMQRRIVPAIGGDDPNHAMMRWLFKEERAKNNQMFHEVMESQRAMSVLLAEFAKQLQGLATARTAGSTIADAGGVGIWHITGALAMIAFLPSIKRQLGLPRDAPVQRVLDRMLLSLEKWGEVQAEAPPGALIGKHEDEAIRRDLDAAAEPDAEGEPRPKSKPRPLELTQDIGADLDRVLAAAKLKPELLEPFVKKVKADPELSDKLMAMFVSGG